MSVPNSNQSSMSTGLKSAITSTNLAYSLSSDVPMQSISLSYGFTAIQLELTSSIIMSPSSITTENQLPKITPEPIFNPTNAPSPSPTSSSSSIPQGSSLARNIVVICGTILLVVILILAVGTFWAILALLNARRQRKRDFSPPYELHPAVNYRRPIQNVPAMNNPVYSGANCLY